MSRSKNPFKIGEMVSGDPFCNRKKEIARLNSAFQDGQNIILISPRRWGKSSLVQEAVRQLKGKAVVVSIDCFGISSQEEFLEIYLKTTLKSSLHLYAVIAEAARKLLKTISSFITYSYGPNNEISFGFKIPVEKMDAVEILNLPAKIATDKKLPVVICIDEFQKISEWKNGDSLLELLRSKWQKHTDVSYCLYGSKRHLMNSLFNDSSKPFYRFGETIFLEKIPREEWTKFIIKQFSATKKSISLEIAEQLVTLVESHSYYVQSLARVCWSLTEKTVTGDILDESYDIFLEDQIPLFRKQTESLTHYQVNYLKALISGETKFTSTTVLSSYNLGSPGNIKRIEKALTDAEIIDTFKGSPELLEPFFRNLFIKYFMRE